MNARTDTLGLRRSSSWRTRCAAGASLAVVLSLATLASSATASFASTHVKSASGSAYCTLLTAYDKKQTTATKDLETPGAAIAAMEAAFKALKSEESVVLGIAPASLQSSYRTIFKDLNVLYTDLSAVNFNYAKLTKAQIAQLRGALEVNGSRRGQDYGLRQERLRRKGLELGWRRRSCHLAFRDIGSASSKTLR